MPARPSWTIADVLDCEALLHLDEQQADAHALAERDARLWKERIAGELAPAEAESVPHVFFAWLKARRETDAHLPQPGTWLSSGWRALGAVALVGGLLAGFAVAGGTLLLPGERKVNVFVFLGTTVGVQWLLLAWALVIWMAHGFRQTAAHTLATAMDHLGRWMAGALDHLSPEERMHVRGEAAALRRLAGRNAEMLRWPPLLALQRFGLAWNIGVLAALLLRPLWHEVVFVWESTWVRDPHIVDAVIHVLAMPWTWFAPGACPSLADIAAARNGSAPGDPAAWGWWLAGVIVVYGALPRIVLFAWMSAKVRASLRGVSFEEPRHRLLWHRLRPLVEPNKSGIDGKLPPAEPAGPIVRQAVPGCVLIASSLAAARPAIEQWVATQLGWTIAACELVEIDFASGNAEALARLAPAFAASQRWIVAVPVRFTAFAAFVQFAGTLPSANTEGCILVVGPNGQVPEEDWTRYWRDFAHAELPDLTVFALNPS